MSERRKRLTHISPTGEVKMVDVSSKTPTQREAHAEAFVRMSAHAVAAAREGGLKKGDALGAARIAAIMAAKRTHELIPLCHPLALTGIDVDLSLTDEGVKISSTVRTTDRTGVEMEALVAASVAALTIYDMCKAVDKGIVIERVQLTYKSGGKSGSWSRER